MGNRVYKSRKSSFDFNPMQQGADREWALLGWFE